MNRHDRRAALAQRTTAFCPDAGDGKGMGCPNCRRFEVRSHPVDCPTHGAHLDLACCWCGTHFYSFREVEDHPQFPTTGRSLPS